MTAHESTATTTVRRGITSTLAALCLALAACSTTVDTDAATELPAAQPTVTVDGSADAGGSAEVVATAVDTGVPTLDDTHADDNDAEFDASEATTITLADGSTSVDGSGASTDGDVITITEPGTYVVSGTLSDGQIVVNSTGDGKVRVVLDNASISSATTSPIVFAEADEAVVVLADGSTNVLTDSAASGADDDAEDAPTATLFSMADLTIAGTGTLDVSGLSNDAIGTKDGLVILSGTINVAAVDDGIRGKDYVFIAGGTIDVVAGGDGVKSDNEDASELGWVQIEAGVITVIAGAQGVDGFGAVAITGGDVRITDSHEGLQAMVITIAGGTVDVVASDDGLNATAHTADGGAEAVEDGVAFEMTGGVLTVAAGSDGLDSNGTATITGGTLAIGTGAGSTGGNGALDVNGAFTAPGVLTIDVSAAAGGDTLDIMDGSGLVVATVVVPVDATALTVTATDIVAGSSYDIVGSSDATSVVATEASETVAVGRGGGGGGGGGGGRP